MSDPRSCPFHGSGHVWFVGTALMNTHSCLICMTAALNNEEPGLLSDDRVAEIVRELDGWVGD